MLALPGVLPKPANRDITIGEGLCSKIDEIIHLQGCQALKFCDGLSLNLAISSGKTLYFFFFGLFVQTNPHCLIKTMKKSTAKALLLDLLIGPLKGCNALHLQRQFLIKRMQ